MPKRPQGVSVYTAHTLPRLLSIRFPVYDNYGVISIVLYVHASGEGGDGEKKWKKGGVKCKCSPQSKWRGFAHTWLKKGQNLPRNLKCS
jgi:hypothetical protein